MRPMCATPPPADHERFPDKAVALTRWGRDKVYGYVPSSFGVNDLIVISPAGRRHAGRVSRPASPGVYLHKHCGGIRWASSLATQYR
jgi:hypothetical protein